MDPAKWFFVFFLIYIVKISADSVYDDLPHEEDDVSGKENNTCILLVLNPEENYWIFFFLCSLTITFTSISIIVSETEA